MQNPEDPVTPRQREYLLDLGVSKRRIPPTKGAASALISQILDERERKRNEMLAEYLDPSEMPTSTDEASDIIMAINFVAACAGKKWGSSQALKKQDTWRIAKGLLEAMRLAEERLEKLQKKQEDLEEKLSSDKLSPESRKKLEARRDRMEDQIQNLEDKASDMRIDLEDIEEREYRDRDGDTMRGVIPDPDSRLARKVYRQFKNCEPQTQGCGAALLLVVALALVFVAVCCGCVTNMGTLHTVTPEEGCIVDRSEAEEVGQFSGESNRGIVLGIPVGVPNLEHAIHEALGAGGGHFMTDVTVRHQWVDLILFGSHKLWVEGTVWRIPGRAAVAPPPPERKRGPLEEIQFERFTSDPEAHKRRKESPLYGLH